VLWTVLREALLLLHPIMPFVSAEIWSALPGHAGHEDISREPFPPVRPACLDRTAAGRMEMIRAVVAVVRTMRAELNISPSLRLSVLIRPADAEAAEVLTRHSALLRFLARLDTCSIDSAVSAPKASAAGIAAGNEVILPLAGVMDFNAELARLDKSLAKLDKEYAMLSGKLADTAYTARAPAEVVARDRARVSELEDARVKLLATRQRFRDAL
jgi:valyl-tRNA synthetase